MIPILLKSHEALVQRLDDLSEDVREEAMVGLAKRRDRRVLTTLLCALEQSPGPHGGA